MTTAQRLLRLYPRAWRERYGEEFLAIVGEGRLGPQQQVDILFGAIDAWLSSDVRQATRVSSAATSGGGTMSVRTMVCEKTRYTTRDGLIGAAVMIVGTALLVFIGFAIGRLGAGLVGEVLMNSAFPVSLMLSMPFWLTKDQPRKVQAVVIAGSVLLLVAINLMALLI